MALLSDARAKIADLHKKRDKSFISDHKSALSEGESIVVSRVEIKVEPKF